MNISSILSNFLAQPISQSQPASAAPSNDTGKSSSGFGAAFELSIRQTTSADGGIEDDASFVAYGANSSGDSAGVTAKGSGSSVTSAFEQLLASLEGSSGEGGSAQPGSDKSASSGSAGILQFLDTIANTLTTDVENALGGGAATAQASSQSGTQTASADPNSASDLANQLIHPHHRHHHHQVAASATDNTPAANAVNTAANAVGGAGTDSGAGDAADATDDTSAALAQALG